MPERRKRVLVVAPAPIVSVILLLIKPLSVLQREGAIEARYVLPRGCAEHDVKWADVVVFCRATDIFEFRILQRARSLGKPVIYDTDDNLFDVPGDSAVARYHRDPLRQRILRLLHAEADLVHVYNRELESIARTLNPNVKRMPQAFDFSLLSKVNVQKRNNIAIAFPTSRGGDDRLSLMFRDAVEAVIRERPHAFTLHVWGGAPKPLQGLPNLIVEPFEPDYNEFIRRLYSSSFAIGLAPLVDDAHHRCKTELKFREYGACRIAGIYSDVSPYKDAVNHGETGLLVSNDPVGWAGALRSLLLDGDLRNRIVSSAEAHVRRHYSLDAAAKAWDASLETVLSIPQRKNSACEANRLHSILARDLSPAKRTLWALRLLKPKALTRLRRNSEWLRAAVQRG
ncbi:glycosyltransferase [Microvirga massiliensis]|uniref:glycosyltransferase n=1 Tax=Microvirga massiliensis TaxID=1033741 RepID=UPI00062B8F52|nr:glycosyltransferase [Microvirga massiliensis]